MKKLLVAALVLLAPAAANATASTMTYATSGTPGRWTATCPAVSGVADCTLDCEQSPIALDCQDANGCTITLAETHSYFDTYFKRSSATSFKSNDQCVVHVTTSTGAVTFADSAGVQETDGTITVPEYGAIRFTYNGSAWAGMAPTGAAATFSSRLPPS